MKNNFGKHLLLLTLFLFSASTIFAQRYVDDLYYNKKNKSHTQQKAERERQERKKYETTQSNRQQRVDDYEDEEEFEDMEYYPGMFADMVSGNSRQRERAESDDNRSNVTISFMSAWSPSWYGYANWNSPFYSPWGSSVWYNNPYDPFYNYGWGYNSWGYNSYWGGCNPYWGHNHWGGYNPYWGHNNYWGGNNYYYGGGYGGGGYYNPPKYNRTNSTYGNGRRDGGVMVGSGSRDNYRPSTSNNGRGGNFSITNQIRNMESNSSRGNNTTTRPNTNSNNSGQYNRRDVQTTPPPTRNTGTVVNNSNTNTNRSSGGGVGGSGGGVVQGTRRR